MKYAKMLNEKIIRELPSPLTISIANPIFGSSEELITFLKGYGKLNEIQMPDNAPSGKHYEARYSNAQRTIQFESTVNDVNQSWELVDDEIESEE